MNLNKYDISYVDEFGAFLRMPLAHLLKYKETQSNTIERLLILKTSPINPINPIVVIEVLARVIFSELLTLFFIAPAFLLSQLGYTVTHFAASRISSQCLKLFPPPLTLPDPKMVKEISTSTLADSIHSTNTTCDRAGLKHMCEMMDLGGDFSIQELSLYLRYIKLKLDGNEVSTEIKDEILEDLNNAGKVCFPTWLEVARKNYNRLYAVPDASVKLLKFASDYKEKSILYFFESSGSLRHWNVLLNSFRKDKLVTEFGLSRDINYDIYACSLDFFSRIKYRLIFNHELRKTNQFVRGIQTRINMENVTDPLFYDILKSSVINRGIANPEDFVRENFYDENYKINFRGTNLLLREVKLIV